MKNVYSNSVKYEFLVLLQVVSGKIPDMLFLNKKYQIIGSEFIRFCVSNKNALFYF